MCGIYGGWHFDGRPMDLQRVRHATNQLAHRGPDDEGYFLADVRGQRAVHCGGSETSGNPDLPVIEALAGQHFDLALGFRRLAILDLTSCGHQPMSTPDGRFTLVYNGEVYNYRELRTELAGRGHVFRGTSDTEVVLAAFAEWEEDCVHRFNGMWAFAVWDREKRQLLLARDRFGVKPLHYVQSEAAFAFASEIKALVGSHGIAFHANGRAVYDYVHAGELPSPQRGETFFYGVQAVPPGFLMRVGCAGVRAWRYYDLPNETPSRTTPDEAAERYGAILRDAVRLRLHADVPVGTCLSGGVDSSSIVAITNDLMAGERGATVQVGDRQKTFSAVYTTAGRYNEREYVEHVLGTVAADGHFVVPTADRLHAELPRLIWHQEEPFGSTSIFAQWCVMGLARERGVTVLLDGQGADEPLAGYRPYDVHIADLLRQRKVLRAFAAWRDLRATGVPATRVLLRAVARQLPNAALARARRAAAAESRLLLRHGFARAHRDGRALPSVNRPLHALLRDLVLEHSLPHLLRYEDRNSMAFSVEGRVPFLDYRLVEYALGDAFRWCIHQGWTKWPLRHAMRGHVPDSVLWRRDKVGFETPERAWQSEWLARAGESHFGAEARSAEYLDIAAVRRYLTSYVHGGGDDRLAWRCINLEMWLRAFA